MQLTLQLAFSILSPTQFSLRVRHYIRNQRNTVRLHACINLSMMSYGRELHTKQIKRCLIRVRAEAFARALYGTVLTLNVLATTDNFMSVDHKAFKTAVWKALDGTIVLLRSCAIFPSSRLVSRLNLEINFGKYDPLLWWRP